MKKMISKVSLLAAIVPFALVACGPPQDDSLKITIPDNSGQNAATNGGTDNNGTDNNGTDNNGQSGSDCVDADGDGWFSGCSDFDDVDGPDCDDADASIWSACDTCVDNDGDGYHGVCDVYDGVDGPDCDDVDANNWDSCDSCVDDDSDGFYVGCDAYTTFEEDCDDAASTTNPGAAETQGNGADDDCDPTTTDECSFPKTPATDPEPGMLAGITAAHNYWRARVGLSPLTWNSDLAASSTDYAEECIWEHDDSRSPDGGFSYVGENLSANSRQPSNAVILDAVESWAEERYDFDYGFTTGQTTGGMVGHYTQIVWDGSNEVGCGWARCNNVQGLTFSATLVVCRYGPGGNYGGQQPYQFKNGACYDMDNDDVWQGMDADDTDRSK